jgi:DNA topoisomerase VI subunit A
LTKIREITLSLLECAANGKPLKLKFKNNKKWANCTMEEGVLKMRSTTTDMKTVNFMAKSSERKFAVMVHIIGEVFKLLSTNSTCTKRFIFKPFSN